MLGKLTFNFGRLRRILASALLVALLAPIFASLLPVPAMSAEQQLAYDLKRFVCSQSQTDQNQKQPHHESGQCCILCGEQTQSFLFSNAILDLKYPSLKLPEKHPIRIVSAQPRAPPDLRASSPRGPPPAQLI
jgi:hypothetical protein